MIYLPVNINSWTTHIDTLTYLFLKRNSYTSKSSWEVLLLENWQSLINCLKWCHLGCIVGNVGFSLEDCTRRYLWLCCIDFEMVFYPANSPTRVKINILLPYQWDGYYVLGFLGMKNSIIQKLLEKFFDSFTRSQMPCKVPTSTPGAVLGLSILPKNTLACS